MKEVFYLKSCDTCMKILKQIDLSDWKLREIKSEPVTEEELEKMYRLTHSYERLFSRRSSQIKAQNIDLNTLRENDFKKLLLSHYTFLKRPVFLAEDQIFIGNDQKNIAALQKFINP